MTDTKIPAKKPWMKILLVVSLGLNLAVAGMFIGARMSGHGSRAAVPHAGGVGMRVLMRALPDRKRAEVRRFFRKNRDKMRANGDAMRVSLDNIGTAIRAQPFNETILHDAFSDQRAHITVITQDAQTAFVAIIASMTDAERVLFVENIEKHRNNWDKDYRHKHRQK